MGWPSKMKLLTLALASIFALLSFKAWDCSPPKPGAAQEQLTLSAFHSLSQENCFEVRLVSPPRARQAVPVSNPGADISRQPRSASQAQKVA